MPEPPPKQFSAEVAASMLKRPWHKQRVEEDLPASWLESQPVQPEQVDDEPDGVPEAALPADDPTGRGVAARRGRGMSDPDPGLKRAMIETDEGVHVLCGAPSLRCRAAARSIGAAREGARAGVRRGRRRGAVPGVHAALLPRQRRVGAGRTSAGQPFSSWRLVLAVSGCGQVAPTAMTLLGGGVGQPLVAREPGEHFFVVVYVGVAAHVDHDAVDRASGEGEGRGVVVRDR
jgi:hypothetical protein